MKRQWIAAVVLVLVCALSAVAYAQDTDPATVVRTSVEAFNAGDLEASLDTWDDDAVARIEIPGAAKVYTGKQEIRAWYEEMVAKHTKLESDIVEVDGNKVTAHSKVWDDVGKGLGIVPWEATEVYIIQDGKIVEMTWTITDECLAQLQAAMANMPQSGGVASSIPALVAALGGLSVLAGTGLWLSVRRRRRA